MAGPFLTPAVILLTIAVQLITIDGAYIGCFRENRRRRIYTHNPGGIRLGTVTPTKCFTVCGGLNYAYGAVGLGKACFCSNTSPEPARLEVDDTKCSLPCDGDPLETCGSATHVRVFDGLLPITLSLEAIPAVVEAGAPVSLTPTFGTLGPGYQLSVDYGDGAQGSIFRTSGDGLQTRTYHQAGNYTVTSFATDPSGMLQDIPTAVAVSVQSPPGDLILTCPSTACTYRTDHCFIDLTRGTDVQLTVDYTDGEFGPPVSQTVLMGDSREYSLGNPVQEKLFLPNASLSSNVSVSGKIMHYVYPAEHQGYLQGFEYFAVATGTLTVYVYSPSCGGNEYCPKVHNCVTPGTCDTYCLGDNFAADIQACAIAGPPDRSFASMMYSLGYQKVITISATGYGYIDCAADGYRVLPGDIVSHDTNGNALLAHVPPAAGSQADLYCVGAQGATATIDGGVCTYSDEMHQLKAVYSSGTTGYIPLDFTDIGTVGMTFTATNRNPNIAGSVTKQVSVFVVEGVNATVFDVTGCLETTISNEIWLKPFTGSPATVYWNFGDGSGGVGNVDAASITHTYSLPGTYNVTANTTNAFSWVYNHTLVCVQERVTGVSMVAPAYAEVGVSQEITLTVTTGSDYNCTVTFANSDASTETLTVTEAEVLGGGLVNKVFNVAGDVTITAVCNNSISISSGTSTVRAVERITGVALTPPGAMKNTDFLILMTVVTGTDFTVSLTYDTVPYPMTVNNAERSAISTTPQQEATTGPHDVVVTVTNVINSVTVTLLFTIEVAITDPVITCTFTNEIYVNPPIAFSVIPAGESVSCEASMSDGTSVTMTIDWGDGSANYTHAIAQGIPWSSDIPAMPITHTYNDPKMCPLRLRLFNAFNEAIGDYPVMVMVGVENVVLDPVGPTGFSPPALVNFTWTVTSGPVPIGVTCVMDWGDGFIETITECDLTAVLQYSYRNSPGSLTLTYTLYNYINSISGSITVEIVTPIIDNVCGSDPIAGIPGTPIFLTFTTRRGPGAGDLDLAFDCDTSVAGNLGTRKRLYNSPFGTDKEPCTYATNGNFTASVTATSLLETKTCFYTMQIFNPVTEEFDVTTNAPVDYEATYQCDLSYTFNYYGPMPDFAWIEFSYGDGTVSAPIAFTTLLVHNYRYATHGHYTTTIRLYNMASEVIRTVSSGCYADITSASMNVLREPILPVGSVDLPAYGMNADKFRIDEPIKIWPTIHTGTFAWYAVTVTGASYSINQNGTVEDVISLPLTEFGAFNLSVQPMNPLYSGPVLTFSGEMMRPVSGISIADYGNETVTYIDRKFRIDMEIFGTAMCIAINNGYEPITQLYGDPVTCASASGEFNDNPSISEMTAPFHISYQYLEEGIFALTMTAWNIFSNETTEFGVAVSGIDCTAPNVGVMNRRRNFRYPQLLKRCKRNAIRGTIDYQCDNTLNNTKEWTIERWDPLYNQRIEDPSLSLANLPSAVKLNLALDPLFLPYGLYRLNFRVTMVTPSPSGVKFYGETQTFINVSECDLIAQIFPNGNNKKTVGPASTITLSPRRNTYDPDIKTGNPDIFDSYEMACIDKTDGETYPDISQKVLPLNYTDLPVGHVDTGGCFQQGPGWITPFDGEITFITSILKPTHVYEFLFIGTKDSRASNFTAEIEVLDIEPPLFDVNFKIPGILAAGSKGTFFNPNSEQVFTAQISSDCGGCNYVYQWTVCVENYEYCDIDPDCMMELNPTQLIADELAAGLQSEDLALYTNLFDLFPSVSNFQVRLTITNDITGASGKAGLNLIRNTPPYGGVCSITPAVGIASQTNFTASCANFTDDHHEIVDYKFTCESDGRQTDVCQGSDALYEFIDLPIGDENNGDILKCNATITDERGASTLYVLDDIVVSGVPVGDFRNVLGDMETNEKDPSDVIEATADLPQAASFAGSLVSQIKKMGRNDEDSDYKDIGCAVSYQSTGLRETRSRPNAFQTRSTDSEKTLAYEKTRSSCAKLVAKLTATIGKCTVESPVEARVMMKMLENLSTAMECLTRATQGLMVTQLKLAVEIMQNYSSSLSVEEIKDMGLSIMDTCAKIDEAAALAVERPPNDDLETIEVYYDSNLDSPEEALPVFEDTEAQMRAAQISANTFDQTNFAVGNLATCSNIVKDVVKILSRVKVETERPTTFSSNGIEVQVYKTNATAFANKEIDTGAGKVKLPKNILGTFSKPVILKTTAKANGGISKEGAQCPFSRVVEMSFEDSDNNEISVQNLPEPITIEITQDPNRFVEESVIPFVQPTFSEEDVEDGLYLAYHKVSVSNLRSAVRFQFRFGAGEVTSGNQLLVLVNYLTTPAIDATNSRVVVAGMVPSHTNHAGFYGNDSIPDPYTFFLDADTISAHGIGNWSIGVRQLVPSELNQYPDKAALPTLDYVQANWIPNSNFTFSYQLKTVEIACFGGREGSYGRDTSGLTPLPTSTGDVLRCSSTHLTSFAGGWIVVPNTIDFDYVFANADFLSNPTLYVTEIVIFLVYIIAMIWARRKDKDDLTKLGLLPLLDNVPRDKYYYEVIVDTGMRRHAGTNSNVSFILSGEEDETEVRTFTRTKRKIFSRGSTDGFLMAVPSSLGALTYLRIWHDNSGKGKMQSWFLNHVAIRDVQTDKKYYFIANRWWAVEEDDGQVDRVIPVAGKEQMTEFSHLFAERASKNLSDGHLWFSVVARPPQSRFTRCQRVSCCLCLLYVSMLANAMFYELASSNSNAYQFGPFAISAEQIYVGIAVNLIVFPINFLIIILFRKSKPRTLRPSRVEAAIESSKSDAPTSTNEINPRVQSSMSTSGRESTMSIGLSRLQTSPIPSDDAPVIAKKTKWQLPWGCCIFAWILLWLTVLASAVFVTFYGITFGEEKCRKWITSMLISFLTSIFLTQPLKVLLIAIIFSVLIRKPGNDDDDNPDDDEQTPTKIQEDEEYLHEDDEYRLVAPMRPAIKKPKPPNPKTLEAARKERLKEIQMWAIVREILFYTFYMTMLLVISYRSVNSDSYRYKYSMERVFIKTNNTNHTFTKVKNVQDYWIWARSGMLRGLRAGPYYNNYPPFYLRGYIDDKQSRIMGYAVLRQIRIRPGTCKIPDLVDEVIHECNAPYNEDDEDVQNYGVGWTDISTSNVTRDEYIYRDAKSLNGYPYWGEMAMYSGGGYVVNLDTSYDAMVSKLEQLEQERWIDKYTRAVFLEFTVYNPSVNLFVISTVLSEFRPSGGVFGSYRFEPCMLLPYMNDMLLFQIACELIYLAFTAYFICNMVHSIYKERLKYFKEFWNLVEFCTTAMSVTAVVIYFYRLVSVKELTDYFNETSGNGYMKFQYVGYWSEIFQYIIGFLVFLATIKFLKLLRFNKKICLLASTLKNSSNNLIHFSIIFNIIFMAFVQVFYLVYLRNLATFKSFVRATEASVVMMMGKFDIYKMSEVNRLFTQSFLFLFVLTITFIVVNMFLSILNEAFSNVRSDEGMQQNDYEIVEFILNRFKMWTGITKAKPTTLSPEELERERKDERIDEQIANLDNQVDRFLASVSNIYSNKSKFDDFLSTGIYGQMAKKAGAHASQFPPPAGHPALRPGAIPLNKGSRVYTDDAQY